ncbi:MAG TPA: hypothetical protein DEF88_00410, partial [Porphyromonadaceae bacterium]|nr:hypothetical protein [Porphyromonadaceae bacterium]
FKKRERIKVLEVLKTVGDNYISKRVVNELVAAKNKEIDWLKDEIRYLRLEIKQLLEIAGRKS